MGGGRCQDGGLEVGDMEYGREVRKMGGVRVGGGKKIQIWKYQN